jgi:hypothetical protein
MPSIYTSPQVNKLPIEKDGRQAIDFLPGAENALRARFQLIGRTRNATTFFVEDQSPTQN